MTCFSWKAGNLSKKEGFGGLSKWEGHMTCLRTKARNLSIEEGLETCPNRKVI